MRIRMRDVNRFVGIHEVGIGLITGLALCAIAAVLLLREGEKRGAADQRLKDLAVQKVEVDNLIARHQRELAAERKKADAADARADSAAHRRNLDRTEFELRGDTALTASARQVLLPEIAQFIRATDFAAPLEVGARHDLRGVITSLDTLETEHIAREKIDDERDRIQEEQAHPRCGFKCGAAIGAGVTLLVVRALASVL